MENNLVFTGLIMHMYVCMQNFELTDAANLNNLYSNYIKKSYICRSLLPHNCTKEENIPAQSPDINLTENL